MHTHRGGCIHSSHYWAGRYEVTSGTPTKHFGHCEKQVHIRSGSINYPIGLIAVQRYDFFLERASFLAKKCSLAAYFSCFLLKIQVLRIKFVKLFADTKN